MRFIVMELGQLIRLSVGLPAFEYLWVLMISMKLGVNKFKKVTRLEFWKKNLIGGIKGDSY